MIILYGVINMDYKNELIVLKGKTIAVVYIFEDETAKGFDHYHIWKSNVIARWIVAIEKIGCKPYIIDVREFVLKSMNNTLPHIDYVLNLNCGSKKLNSMSLVPSTCSFLDIPCIPCNASSIVIGENKKISNLIATAMNLNVPQDVHLPQEDAILRPLNFGSSFGITKGKKSHINKDELYQEFIPGYEITFPFLYNPLINKIDFLPGVLYLPYSKDPNWFFGEKEKSGAKTFENYPLYYLSNCAKEKLRSFAEIFPIETYGRIDIRLKTKEQKLSNAICNTEIKAEDIYFVEINPMPTVKLNNAFYFSFESIDEINVFDTCLTIHKQIFKDIDVNTFLLSNSMLALK